MSSAINKLSVIIVFVFAYVFTYGQALKTQEPIATIAGKSSGNIRSPELRAQLGVRANFKGDDKSKIVVQSFTLTVKHGEKTSFIKDNTGAIFSGECRAIIDRVQPGDKVIVTNIKAKGLDGVVKSLAPIELKVVK